MHWRIKGLAQKTLAALPGGVRVNTLLQQAVGELRRFDKHLASKVEDWCILASHMRELGVPLTGLVYLEIGTGWFPALPICYTLAGARAVMTFDQTRFLRPKLLTRTVALLRDHLPAISAASGRPVAEIEGEYARLTKAADVPELLRRARIDYHAPADVTATGLGPCSVDVVFSNSVLEHVPAEAIGRMFREAYRVLRLGGLMVHSVNCGDHYAYFDRKITAINYLKFTKAEWAFWDNGLLYQNRMRPNDFVSMAGASGFTIALRKQKPRPALMDWLRTQTIAPEFSDYPLEELCTTSIDFVARKPSV